MRRQLIVLSTAGLLIAGTVWGGDLFAETLRSIVFGAGTASRGIPQPVVDTVFRVVVIDGIFLLVTGAYFTLRDRASIFNSTGLPSEVAGITQRSLRDRVAESVSERWLRGRSRGLLEATSRRISRQPWSRRASESHIEIQRLLAADLPVSAKIGLAIGGYFALVGVELFTGILYSLFAVDRASTTITKIGRQYPSLFALLVPLSLFVIAPCEELFFRKTVHAHLSRGFGQPLTIGIASVLFALAHLGTIRGATAFGALGTLALIGVFLSLAYEVTGSLLAPILMHGAYNATLFALAYFL